MDRISLEPSLITFPQIDQQTQQTQQSFNMLLWIVQQINIGITITALEASETNTLRTVP
jgi:hypothetical protein